MLLAILIGLTPVIGAIGAVISPGFEAAFLESSAPIRKDTDRFGQVFLLKLFARLLWCENRV